MKEKQYQMLDRLRTDCEYFLGNGKANIEDLYYKNIDEQVEEMLKLWNSFNENEKPEWINADEIDNYRKEMKTRFNLVEMYNDVLKQIPGEFSKYYNSLSNIDFSENNYQLRSNIENIKSIIDNLQIIENSKENINVLVLWSESSIYKNNTLYTLSEMQGKSYFATEEINREKEKIGLDHIYNKTKYILIGKEDNGLIFHKNRYDIGDCSSFIEDFTKGVSAETYKKFAKLDNNLLKYPYNEELVKQINNVLEKAMSETLNGSAIIGTDEIDLNNEEIKMIIQNDPRISDVEFYKENGKDVADIVFYLENCPNLDLGQDEMEQQQENRLDKIKNFLEQIKDLDYKDYFCAVILNEVIDNKQDITDLTDKDLKVCDKFYNEYKENDSMQLLGNELVDMINGTYSFQNENEYEEDI